MTAVGLDLPVVRNDAMAAAAATPPTSFVNPVSFLESIDVRQSASVASYFPNNAIDIDFLTKRVTENAEKGLESILSIPWLQKSFLNTFFALDALETYVYTNMRTLDVVSKSHPDEKVRNAAKAGCEMLQAFSLDQFVNNKRLYTAFVYVESKNEQLTEQQRAFLESKMRSCKREGLHLDETTFAEILQLKKDISKLESTYLQNANEDASFKWVRLGDLVGVPENVISGLQRDGELYKLTCDYPIYFPVMQFCEVEATRKEMYHLFVNRASGNMNILTELISARHLLAQKLGYASFTDYDLENHMAGKPYVVQKFLDDLAFASQPKSDVEIAAMTNPLTPSVKLTEDGKIKPWDYIFLKEAYRKNKFNVDEVKIQEYFPFDPVLKKIFALYEEMFELKFEEVSNAGLWETKTTKMVEVRLRDENWLIGHVVLDLFPRDGKFKHAYCKDVLAPFKMIGGQFKPGIAVVLANITAPTEDKPSILMHSEVMTVFHELGHALHQLLGVAEMPSLSGYHVKCDFLEVPSQLLEDLLYEPAIIRRLSSHYKTQEPLPEDLIKSKVDSRHYIEGTGNLRIIVDSRVSLDYFKSETTNTRAVREELMRKYTPFLAEYADSKVECSFQHLADSLYRAKYYCYLWAEVFAKDVYKHIQHLAKVRSENPWMLYRRMILEPGGGIDPNILLERFLGRAPNMEAFKEALKVNPKPWKDKTIKQEKSGGWCRPITLLVTTYATPVLLTACSNNVCTMTPVMQYGVMPAACVATVLAIKKVYDCCFSRPVTATKKLS